VWLAVTLFGRDVLTSDFGAPVDIVAVILVIIGVPFALFSVARVLWPGVFEVVGARARWGVVVAVVLIAAGSFVLGAFHEKYLTCDDFEVSGNSRPPGCVLTPID
jgi:hypothetical protein